MWAWNLFTSLLWNTTPRGSLLFCSSAWSLHWTDLCLWTRMGWRWLLIKYVDRLHGGEREGSSVLILLCSWCLLLLWMVIRNMMMILILLSFQVLCSALLLSSLHDCWYHHSSFQPFTQIVFSLFYFLCSSFIVFASWSYCVLFLLLFDGLIRQCDVQVPHCLLLLEWSLCLGHGRCLQPSDRCKCNTGWAGDGCERLLCENDCSNHGTCVDCKWRVAEGEKRKHEACHDSTNNQQREEEDKGETEKESFSHLDICPCLSEAFLRIVCQSVNVFVHPSTPSLLFAFPLFFFLIPCFSDYNFLFCAFPFASCFSCVSVSQVYVFVTPFILALPVHSRDVRIPVMHQLMGSV